MPSLRKLAANRANAQKSTGPRTAKGKRNTHLNATPASQPNGQALSRQTESRQTSTSGPHGLFSKLVVLGGESEDRFKTLLRSCHDHFLPTTPVECDLIENMAIARWRLARAVTPRSVTIDTAGVNFAVASQPQDALVPAFAHRNDASTRTMLAFQDLNGRGYHSENIHRFEAAYDRAAFPNPQPKQANNRRKSPQKTAGATRTQFFKQNKGLTKTVGAI